MRRLRLPRVQVVVVFFASSNKGDPMMDAVVTTHYMFTPSPDMIK